MRQTIQRQFRDPIVLIVGGVVLAVTLATVTWYAQTAWRQEQTRIRRVLDSLAAPRFPLHRSVLDQIAQLSGVELAVVTSGEITESTWQPTDEDRERVKEWLLTDHESGPAEPLPLDLSRGPYLADRLVLATSSRDDSMLPRQLIVLTPRPDRWQIWRRAAIGPLIIGGAGCLLLWALIAWRARQVVRPLALLQRQAASIAAGDFRGLELPERDDEVRDLVVAINVMVERLARFEDQVRRQERMQTLSQLAGGLAHHLRNAATGGRLALELHQRQCHSARGDEDLRVALQQFTQIEQYLQRLLVMSRAEPTPAEPRIAVDLAQLLREVVAFLTPLCRHARVEFDTSGIALDSAIVSGWRQPLEQVLVNLAMNGLEAVKGLPAERRRLALELSCRDDVFELNVCDAGAGPAAAMADAMFDPFASDKPDGVGLGLAVARRVAIEHGGEVSWGRRDGLTVFTVRLPVMIEVPHGATIGSR